MPRPDGPQLSGRPQSRACPTTRRAAARLSGRGGRRGRPRSVAKTAASRSTCAEMAGRGATHSRAAVQARAARPPEFPNVSGLVSAPRHTQPLRCRGLRLRPCCLRGPLWCSRSGGQGVLAVAAARTAAASDKEFLPVHSKLAQRLSVFPHMENARAVLRRLPGAGAHVCRSRVEAAVLASPAT
jgi:hypothetical protein